MALQNRSVLSSLLRDVVLLALFTAQHSLLAWAPVKQTLRSVLGVLARAAYCFTTALALQVGQPLLLFPTVGNTLLAHFFIYLLVFRF